MSKSKKLSIEWSQMSDIIGELLWGLAAEMWGENKQNHTGVDKYYINNMCGGDFVYDMSLSDLSAEIDNDSIYAIKHAGYLVQEHQNNPARKFLKAIQNYIKDSVKNRRNYKDFKSGISNQMQHDILDAEDARDDVNDLYYDITHKELD